MREYAQLGLQFIITLIDSELPTGTESDGPVFAESEIVLRLHDEGPDGRLFRMASW